jgi:hypothetical protein
MAVPLCGLQNRGARAREDAPWTSAHSASCYLCTPYNHVIAWLKKALYDKAGLGRQELCKQRPTASAS